MQDQKVIWCEKCQEYHVRIGTMILGSTYVPAPK